MLKDLVLLNYIKPFGTDVLDRSLT